VIECFDNEIAKAIAGYKETGSLCLRAGPKILLVRTDHLDKFRERVRPLGFGMKCEQSMSAKDRFWLEPISSPILPLCE
jgi:hypothetical protein